LSKLKDSLKSSVSSGTSINHSSHQFDRPETFVWRARPPPPPIVGIVVKALHDDGGSVNGAR
jgi:hypothetical protein